MVWKLNICRGYLTYFYESLTVSFEIQCLKFEIQYLIQPIKRTLLKDEIFMVNEMSFNIITYRSKQTKTFSFFEINLFIDEH